MRRPFFALWEAALTVLAVGVIAYFTAELLMEEDPVDAMMERESSQEGTNGWQ